MAITRSPLFTSHLLAGTPMNQTTQLRQWKEDPKVHLGAVILARPLLLSAFRTFNWSPAFRGTTTNSQSPRPETYQAEFKSISTTAKATWISKFLRLTVVSWWGSVTAMATA